MCLLEATVLIAPTWKSKATEAFKNSHSQNPRGEFYSAGAQSPPSRNWHLLQWTQRVPSEEEDQKLTVYQAADLTFKLRVQRLTWCIFNRPPLLGRMEEFLVSTTMACWKTKTVRAQLWWAERGHGETHTDREDLRECPLSSRTAKEAPGARQPSSLHTPSHFRVWLVFNIGN